MIDPEISFRRRIEMQLSIGEKESTQALVKSVRKGACKR
jgi:hypothetical protein